MNEFKQYRRRSISEMRCITSAECRGYHTAYAELMSDGVKVSISEADKKNGSPKVGDMIARNPKNYKDQWLVAEKYFIENLEPLN